MARGHDRLSPRREVTAPHQTAVILVLPRLEQILEHRVRFDDPDLDYAICAALTR
jgi:hypothetical protein